MKRTGLKETSLANKKVSYGDIEHVVEYLVAAKSSANVFYGWTRDDVAQEIRIICLNAIKHFDPEKAKTEKQILNFFGRSVDNRLKNLKRDNYIKYDNTGCEEKQKLVERRLNIRHALPLDTITDVAMGKSETFDECEYRDLLLFVYEKLDSKNKKIFNKMLSGAKNVTQKQRASIRDAVSSILKSIE